MRKILPTFIILIPCLIGCGKTTANTLNYDKYYLWLTSNNSNGEKCDFIETGASNYIEVTKSTLIYVTYDSHGKETSKQSYEYQSKGSSIFKSRYSQEYLENHQKESIEQYYEYVFDYGEGYLKSTKLNAYGDYIFYVTEDFAKSLNFHIEAKS